MSIVLSGKIVLGELRQPRRVEALVVDNGKDIFSGSVVDPGHGDEGCCGMVQQCDAVEVVIRVMSRLRMVSATA